jgi:hypothetical protein
MTPSRSLITLLAATFVVSAAFAQSAPQVPNASQPKPVAVEEDVPTYIRAETPEQRMARIGTETDPGTNPDPEKVWTRFGKQYKIERFDARFANYQDVEPGQVKPFGFVNSHQEIYQVSKKWVWVWIEQKAPETAETLEAPVQDSKYQAYNEEEVNYFQSMRSEFAPLDVPASDRKLKFESSSEGLPKNGSWRNTIAVGDMNGDKKLDIIVPSERGGNNRPAIFLGDGTGKWQFWKGVSWPMGVNYGSVEVGDFNRDGAMDIAYGVHLGGVRVMLGDNKGFFSDASNGLPRDFATRRVKVTDVDGDGDLDVVAISEGPTVTVTPKPYARLLAFINDGTGKNWTTINISAQATKFGGDFMTVGNFNGDKLPDFIGASVFFNATEIIYLSDGAKSWRNVGAIGTVIPFLSYHAAQAAGRFSNLKVDDAILSYIRFWPENIDPKTIPAPPLKTTTGIDRISFPAGKQPVRTPIVRWEGNNGVYGMATGDFDGDGKLDVAYTRSNPRSLEILLGDGKGGFTRAATEGLTISANNPNYDLKSADVNGDGRPDLIIMYEATGTTRFAERDGSIEVFLNRGAAVAETGR